MNQFIGKFRRFFTSLIFSVDANRAGDCRNCGACCMFFSKCIFLEYDDDSAKFRCRIYDIRPLQCRKYPRTPGEQSHKPCGYYFEESSKQ